MGLLATPIVLFTTNFFWQGLSRRSGSSHLIPAKADVMASFSAWLKEDFDFNDAQDDESPILSQTAKEALDQLDRSYRSLRISAHLKDTRDAGVIQSFSCILLASPSCEKWIFSLDRGRRTYRGG